MGITRLKFSDWCGADLAPLRCLSAASTSSNNTQTVVIYYDATIVHKTGIVCHKKIALVLHK